MERKGIAWQSRYQEKGLTFVFLMKDISSVFEQLITPSKVVVTMHQKPDPDAMGSSLALWHFLKAMGHDVRVISPTNWADFLKWMPGIEDALDFESQGDKARSVLSEADWIFCLDFNHFSRTRHMQSVLEALTCKKVLIDHHREPQTESFDFGNSDIRKSSTAEMIYDFILMSGRKDLLNKDIATCIYAGVMADTGSFRFASTTPSVHYMVAELQAYGIDHTRIHSNVYDNFQENRLRFIGHVLSNRLEVLYEYNTALIAIPKTDILRFHIKTGDTEGLVNYPLSIQGIEMAALLIDRDEERKWSFRSKESFDCNTFARKYFEGGGHYNASGGRSSASVEENVRLFKEALKEFTNNSKK
jgi:phosphoesterase RecJ-like protein